jgi:hypothetical protein
MPTGPKGQKRKADVIGNAVHIMRIATGEEVDNSPRERGSQGGEARAKLLRPEKRREIAARAAKARWAKHTAPAQEDVDEPEGQ